MFLRVFSISSLYFLYSVLHLKQQGQISKTIDNILRIFIIQKLLVREQVTTYIFCFKRRIMENFLGKSRFSHLSSAIEDNNLSLKKPFFQIFFYNSCYHNNKINTKIVISLSIFKEKANRFSLFFYMVPPLFFAYVALTPDPLPEERGGKLYRCCTATSLSICTDMPWHVSIDY